MEPRVGFQKIVCGNGFIYFKKQKFLVVVLNESKILLPDFGDYFYLKQNTDNIFVKKDRIFVVDSMNKLYEVKIYKNAVLHLIQKQNTIVTLSTTEQDYSPTYHPLKPCNHSIHFLNLLSVD